MLTEKIIRSGAVALRGRATGLLAAQFAPPVMREFGFSELRGDLDRKEIKEWLNEALKDRICLPAIYRITATEQAGARRLFEAFEPEKSNAVFMLPRRNKVPLGQTIYVGSSKSIKSRMYQHLKQAPKGTYALHLGRWCPIAPHRLKVEIQTPIGEVAPAVIQDAEDALWDQSCPLFGRRGAR